MLSTSTLIERRVVPALELVLLFAKRWHLLENPSRRLALLKTPPLASIEVYLALTLVKRRLRLCERDDRPVPYDFERVSTMLDLRSEVHS